MNYKEINFDGLIGPTHNYSGLAVGNLASSKNANLTSHPKEAALQGINKMRTLMRLGYTQGFLLPNARPDLATLRNLGFQGSDERVILDAANSAPELLTMVYSASSMWAANAATVTPSLDSLDAKVHLTPANLLTTAHRAIEHTQTFEILKTVFSNEAHFKVHPALTPHLNFADEGAANHTRLGNNYGEPGVGLFVYGRTAESATSRFPARQTLTASRSIARGHGTKDAIFLLQNPKAIDAGAFHNDVVAVGNGPALFFHELAFEPTQQQAIFEELSQRMAFMPICVSNKDVPIEDAITSYLFNSQLLASPDGDVGSMRLIAPTESRDNPRVKAYLERLVTDFSQPIRDVIYVDVRQSMSNGGGPACLRLRVLLSAEEVNAVNHQFILNEERADWLEGWVNRHYRDNLTPSDLTDPALAFESFAALDELTKQLNCYGVYPHQKN
jgi:succinylarginine dihydrolase